jgi:HSP20 family protein
MLPRIHGLDTHLFEEFRRLEQEMDHLFGARFWPDTMRPVAGESYPPINVGMTQEQVDVYLFASGLDSDKLDVSIHDNQLSIKGERKLERNDEARYFRKERHDGVFHKRVNLPDDIDVEKVEARYENGVLHLVIQRHEASKPRQIAIQ